MSIKEYIKSLKYDLNITDTGEEIYLTHKEWHDKEIIFDVDDTIESVNERLKFLKYTFFGNTGCYKKNYFEILVIKPDIHFFDFYEVPVMNKHKDKAYYEISTVSDILYNSIEVYTPFDNDIIENFESLISLKVFNLDKYIDSIDEDKIIEITNHILFDLYCKHGIDFKIQVLPDDIYDHDPYAEMLDKIEEVNNNIIEGNYDKDLIHHFITAKNMDDSQFKYLAFYQVVECIFDEVYLESTIEDVKQIINSNWFSSKEKKDIAEVINLIDKYNTNRKDIEKLRIVLEKYFRGMMHDEAFFKVNREVIKILRDELGLIQEVEELKNLNNLSKIIYEFRCLCTHSNRAFSVNYNDKYDNLKLNAYIRLIKEISEKIILSYTD